MVMGISLLLPFCVLPACSSDIDSLSCQKEVLIVRTVSSNCYRRIMKIQHYERDYTFCTLRHTPFWSDVLVNNIMLDGETVFVVSCSGGGRCPTIVAQITFVTLYVQAARYTNVGTR